MKDKAEIAVHTGWGEELTLIEVPRWVAGTLWQQRFQENGEVW